MRSWMLTVAALVVPLVWGVVSYWLLDRVWFGRGGVSGPSGREPAAEPLDFQI